MLIAAVDLCSFPNCSCTDQRNRTSNLKRRRKERPDGLIERARAHHARVSITSNANELIQAEKDRGGHRDPLANLLFF